MNSKEQLAKAAKEWLNTLESSKYETLMHTAYDNTYYYPKEVVTDRLPYLRNQMLGNRHTNPMVFCNDVVNCVKAACSRYKEPICVLDFASYYNPGGGFLKGSIAQEESICYVSGLYPCLMKFKNVYDVRNAEHHNPMYGDDYIYVQQCPFIVNGKTMTADVLAIAAPNAKAAKASEQEIYDTLYRRMEIAYLEPKIKGCDNLILGAFGCGVFGNDTQTVANIWKDIMKTYDGLYENVVFAITDKDMTKVFKKTLL